MTALGYSHINRKADVDSVAHCFINMLPAVKKPNTFPTRNISLPKSTLLNISWRAVHKLPPGPRVDVVGFDIVRQKVDRITYIITPRTNSGRLESSQYARGHH